MEEQKEEKQKPEIIIPGLRDAGTPTAFEGPNIMRDPLAPRPEAPLVHVPEVTKDAPQEAREVIVRMMDERDEEAILADLQGLALRYVQRMVYAYCPDHKAADEDALTGWPTCGCASNKWVVDVSYPGVREAANKEGIGSLLEYMLTKRGNLLIHERYELVPSPGTGVLIPRTVDYRVEVHEALVNVPDFVRAHAYAFGGGRPSRQGFAIEPLMKKGRNGLYENTFAELKAAGKAMRNALKQHISQVLIRDWTDKFLGIGAGVATSGKTPKTLLKAKLAEFYGDDTELQVKAFKNITSRMFFPDSEEPRFYSSFTEISQDEAAQILAAITEGKLVLPAKEILSPTPV